jgi:hypothetical protein
MHYAQRCTVPEHIIDTLVSADGMLGCVPKMLWLGLVMRRTEPVVPSIPMCRFPPCFRMGSCCSSSLPMYVKFMYVCIGEKRPNDLFWLLSHLRALLHRVSGRGASMISWNFLSCIWNILCSIAYGSTKWKFYAIGYFVLQRQSKHTVWNFLESDERMSNFVCGHFISTLLSIPIVSERLSGRARLQMHVTSLRRPSGCFAMGEEELLLHQLGKLWTQTVSTTVGACVSFMVSWHLCHVVAWVGADIGWRRASSTLWRPCNGWTAACFASW